MAPGSTPTARIRASLLAVVLATQVLLAFPAVGRLDVEAVPTVVVYGATALDRVRHALLTPWRPIQRLTGTGQSWGMFAQPDRRPRRLEVAVRTADGDWTSVIRKNSGSTPEFLRDRRIRALYDTAPDDGSPRYWTFTRWLGRVVLEDHPEATEVRVRLVETVTTDPWLPTDPAETVFLERIHRRYALFEEPL